MPELYGHYYTLVVDPRQRLLYIIPKRGAVEERKYNKWLLTKLQKATKHQLDDIVDELWS